MYTPGDTNLINGLPTVQEFFNFLTKKKFMYIVFSYEISVCVFLIREDSTDRPLSEQQENAFLT